MTIKIDPEKLTKAQVCAILHIGYSTLGKWMRNGKIKFTRDTEAGKFESAVFFSRADLAEFLPSTAPSAPEPKRNAPPGPVGHYEDDVSRNEPATDKRTFAEKYRDGDATDSCGNTIHGGNSQYPTTGATLLGPVKPYEGPPIPKTGTSHMDPHLLSDYVDPNFAPLISPSLNNGEGFTRGGSPLCTGYSQEKYDADMQAWRRSGGGRSEGEQELAIRRAKENINRAFPKP
jgi:hypothetical protein